MFCKIAHHSTRCALLSSSHHVPIATICHGRLMTVIDNNHLKNFPQKELINHVQRYATSHFDSKAGDTKFIYEEAKKFPKTLFVAVDAQLKELTMKFDITHLTFQHPKKENRELLSRWLSKPYILPYWNDDGYTLQDLEKFFQGKSLFQHYLTLYQGMPMAYFMTSEVSDLDDDYAHWAEPGEVTLTLDFLIGEEAFLGKGLSHILIEQFLQRHCAHAATVLIDPQVNNLRALRAYEKAGFVKITDASPQGEKYLMMKRRLK